MNTDSYEIEARAMQATTKAQLDRMFQTLLADRFRLQLHRETRELPVYALVIDKKGSKLKLNDTADEFSGRIGPNIFNPGRGPAWNDRCRRSDIGIKLEVVSDSSAPGD